MLAKKRAPLALEKNLLERVVQLFPSKSNLCSLSSPLCLSFSFASSLLSYFALSWRASLARSATNKGRGPSVLRAKNSHELYPPELHKKKHWLTVLWHQKQSESKFRCEIFPILIQTQNSFQFDGNVENCSTILNNNNRVISQVTQQWWFRHWLMNLLRLSFAVYYASNVGNRYVDPSKEAKDLQTRFHIIVFHSLGSYSHHSYTVYSRMGSTFVYLHQQPVSSKIAYTFLKPLKALSITALSLLYNLSILESLSIQIRL